MRTAEELARDFLRRVHGLAGLMDHDAGRSGLIRIDLEDHGLRDPDAARLEGGFERRAQMDHLAVRGPEARLHQEVALLFRRRIEQGVRDPFRRQIEVDVLRVAVRRAHLPVLELVAAFRVGLDQADDVMLPDEPESAVPKLHPRYGDAEGHPTPRVPLHALPLPGVTPGARPPAAEGVALPPPSGGP